MLKSIFIILSYKKDNNMSLYYWIYISIISYYEYIWFYIYEIITIYVLYY